MATKEILPRASSLLSSLSSPACCSSQSSLSPSSIYHVDTMIGLRTMRRTTTALPAISSQRRHFSSTPVTFDWLRPKQGESSKSRKGRPRVPTGGSVKGTTLVWGDYGIRMRDHDRRISAAQLKIADETIRKRLRGLRYRLYHRVSADIGVYTSGNDMRMGKGKGSFDHWASRVAVSKIIFELKTDIHEQIVRDALRLAGNKLPGLYEFVRKGDPPVMGLTKVGNGTTEAMLRRPRLDKNTPKPNLQVTSQRLPATTPV